MQRQLKKKPILCMLKLHTLHEPGSFYYFRQVHVINDAQVKQEKDSLYGKSQHRSCRGWWCSSEQNLLCIRSIKKKENSHSTFNGSQINLSYNLGMLELQSHDTDRMTDCSFSTFLQVAQ